MGRHDIDVCRVLRIRLLLRSVHSLNRNHPLNLNLKIIELVDRYVGAVTLPYPLVEEKNTMKVGGADTKLSNKKMCTACEQKVMFSNEDGSPNITNVSRSNNADDNIDVVSVGLDRMKLSNDAGSVDISDDKLFKDPPPREDCPICMLPLPHATGECGVKVVYQPCCGKFLCRGCVEASKDEIRKGHIKEWCPLCRAPIPDSYEEKVSFLKKRMGVNDPEAFHRLGLYYFVGVGVSQDYNKAFELWHQAAKLGSIDAHYKLGIAHHNGEEVEREMGKAIYHYKIAAMGGHESARYNLGIIEGSRGNISLSMKHVMTAARAGHDESLKLVGTG